jgi:hypothetical protein
MRYSFSNLKVQRAKKHIGEIGNIVEQFSRSDLYTVAVKKYVEPNATINRVEITQIESFPVEDVAVVIGDVLHNLRSALDILWYQTVVKCGGTPSGNTNFPIYDTREYLESKVAGALEKKQISATVEGLITQTVKPYETGNFSLWALHKMNIRDKHQLLIPVFELVRLLNVRFKEEEGAMFSMNVELPFGPMNWFSRGDKTAQVDDKGQAALTVRFQPGFPFEGEPVIPTLARVAEEVSYVIDFFAEKGFGLG